jgi:hypothetical protein
MVELMGVMDLTIEIQNKWRENCYVKLVLFVTFWILRTLFTRLYVAAQNFCWMHFNYYDGRVSEQKVLLLIGKE